MIAVGSKGSALRGAAKAPRADRKIEMISTGEPVRKRQGRLRTEKTKQLRTIAQRGLNADLRQQIGGSKQVL